jgi:hypothetical protein
MLLPSAPGTFFLGGEDDVRMLLLFVVLTGLAVAGIDNLTSGQRTAIKEWAPEPNMVRVETRNGPLYYSE